MSRQTTTIAATKRRSIVVPAKPVDTSAVVISTVSVATIASEVYGQPMESVKFLDSIFWLDISNDTFTTRLAEIMASVQIDVARTEAIALSSAVKSYADLQPLLLQNRQLEAIRQTRSTLETKPPPGKWMDKPCRRKDCKKNEFRCFIGAPSSGDEQIRSWRICSACGTYDEDF